MGIKVSVNNKPREPYVLLPVGEYLFQITGQEIDQRDNKIKMKFQILRGVQPGYENKTVSRKFNSVISVKSHLGELLAVLGTNVEALQDNCQVDLGSLNTRQVFGTIAHYQTGRPDVGQQGFINSITNFRAAEGGDVPAVQATTVAQPVPTPAPAPVPAVAPVQPTSTPAPVAAPAPVPVQPVSAPVPAPAPVQPVPNPTQVQAAPPAGGKKLSF